MTPFDLMVYRIQGIRVGAKHPNAFHTGYWRTLTLITEDGAEIPIELHSASDDVTTLDFRDREGNFV